MALARPRSVLDLPSPSCKLGDMTSTRKITAGPEACHRAYIRQQAEMAARHEDLIDRYVELYVRDRDAQDIEYAQAMWGDRLIEWGVDIEARIAEANG